MKVVYVAIPNEYINFVDGIVATLKDMPGATVRSVSIPSLAIIDLQYQTLNPPDDLVRFWIGERRRLDRNYWLQKFLSFAERVRKFSGLPTVVILVGSDDEPAARYIVDVVYQGNVKATKEKIIAALESKRGN